MLCGINSTIAFKSLLRFPLYWNLNWIAPICLNNNKIENNREFWVKFTASLRHLAKGYSIFGLEIGVREYVALIKTHSGQFTVHYNITINRTIPLKYISIQSSFISTQFSSFSHCSRFSIRVFSLTFILSYHFRTQHSSSNDVSFVIARVIHSTIYPCMFTCYRSRVHLL